MDLDLDVTSGLRFHPVEIVISLLIKDSAIILFGIPVYALFLFEVILNGTSLFNHSNIYMPPVFDRLLRLLVVTPDMHRIHHSGFNIPWWDRLLGTCTGCSLFPFFPYPKQSGQHREILTRFKCSI